MDNWTINKHLYRKKERSYLILVTWHPGVHYVALSAVFFLEYTMHNSPPALCHCMLQHVHSLSVAVLAAVAQHSPVKRHHSTGDMLGGDTGGGDRGGPIDFQQYELRPTNGEVRPRRPKSEGNFYGNKIRPKRASSFGVSLRVRVQTYWNLIQWI